MAKRFLFAVWAGGGNVPPQLALARRLGERGHEVRVLAPGSLRDRILQAGLIHEPYRTAPEHDEAVPAQSLIRDFVGGDIRDRLFVGMTGPIAADVLSILERHSIDLIATDHQLFGGLFAAEKAGIPSAILFHTISFIRSMPTHWARGMLPALNEQRARFGLPPLGTLVELVDEADGAFMILASRSFDFPDGVPPKVDYVGPQLDEPSWTAPWESPWPPDDPRPLVVVGLTTTYQGQDRLLKNVVRALGTLPVRALVATSGLDAGEASPNVRLARFVPHPRVLPLADLVVTHAGLGTVMAALSHGLPLVCLPLGRDQPENAARVVSHGAGVRLPSRSSAARIAAAVQGVLDDASLAEAARRLARAIHDEDPERRGPDELERLANGRSAAP
jgi:MGT family glycosyltransferase